MAQMTIQQWVKEYYASAAYIERHFGIPAEVTLAQSAWESAWGKHAPEFNFFGITAGGNYTGKRQLLKTTEYHKSPNVKYPVVYSVTRVGNQYKYSVKRYFRAYNNALESFYDYAWLLVLNRRYYKAFYHNDPVNFLTEVANAGYATDPNYVKGVSQIIRSISKLIETA